MKIKRNGEIVWGSQDYILGPVKVSSLSKRQLKAISRLPVVKKIRPGWSYLTPDGFYLIPGTQVITWVITSREGGDER